MNLVVDIGNTRVKAACFNHHNLVEDVVLHNTDGVTALAIAWRCKRSILSSVKEEASGLKEGLLAIGPVYGLSPELPIPIKNTYATPQTLGADRIAAAVGGYAHFPGKNILVFDAGTCLTTEFITADGVYRGGAIAPGVNMRLKAMSQFTANLPLAPLALELPPLTGHNTETCLQSGAINGMLAEIEGTIVRYSKQYSDLQVILCGGDAKIFENKVKPAIFVLPKLVLYGLNEILLHNAQ